MRGIRQSLGKRIRRNPEWQYRCGVGYYYQHSLAVTAVTVGISLFMSCLFLYIAWRAGFSAYKPPFSPLSYSEGGTPRQPTNRGLLTTIAIGSCLWSFILSLFIQLSTLFSERFSRVLSFGLVTGQETFTCGWVRLGRHTNQLREGSRIFPHR